MSMKSPSGSTGMSGKSQNLHSGLSRKAPKGVDASMSPKGGSVNSDATRSGTAASPRTIGPRDA